MFTRTLIFLLFFPVLAQPVLSADGEGPNWRVFRYTMAGRVRFLLFWVGKDDVGGGSIGLLQNKGSDGRITDSVEVLFGSNPKRVPGKINRWGYGRESAQWKDGTSQADGGTLLASTFEGFMRHSNEESLGEVRTKASKDQAEETFWYDAIQSRVTSEQASSTVHMFAEKEDFDYTQPGAVECGYLRRLKAGPPDRSRQLKRIEFSYPAPYGFLTAVKALVADVCTRINSKNWSGYRPGLTYLYNATPYRLVVTDLELHREYTAPGWKLRDVIEAEFEATNLKTNEEHSFVLWFPASGALQNVPVRIVDKPRWWLRVELTLDPAAANGGNVQTSGAMPPCSEAP
jgi:hypothetical protein